MTRILILCTGNSCRSQMAEAILRSHDPGLDVSSAGTHPASRVHPLAVAVMADSGIDMSAAAPKPVERFLKEPFDYVITVCSDAEENCPVFTGKVRHRVHIPFDDPAKATGSVDHIRGEFARVRDEIADRILRWWDHTQQGTRHG
jgi:arsenate reductase